MNLYKVTIDDFTLPDNCSRTYYISTLMYDDCEQLIKAVRSILKRKSFSGFSPNISSFKIERIGELYNYEEEMQKCQK